MRVINHWDYLLPLIHKVVHSSETFYMRNPLLGDCIICQTRCDDNTAIGFPIIVFVQESARQNLAVTSAGYPRSS
jgi:hypothetical protein